ncbi:hypothetical protein CA54_43430 [Symmachiella macrocystis]|uniref:Uncharacterized protein n=1 Tax=Symmachiella macrocystis TaxID=2527985 RepID=A0A5C6BAJ5_9PLAN|nr:hypothetical protein CA54_43430 [Symmachiella macrocystis]
MVPFWIEASLESLPQTIVLVMGALVAFFTLFTVGRPGV